MEIALLSGLLGILGGIVSGLVVSIFSQRKNNAEIKRLEAETKKINLELETVQNNWYREILTTLYNYIQTAVGKTSHLTRAIRSKPILLGMKDEYILDSLKDNFTEFELKQLLNAPDRDKYLSELEACHEYYDAQKAETEYRNFLILKKLFIDDERILTACFELDRILIDLINITEWNVKKIAPGNLSEAHSKYNSAIVPAVEKVEELLRPYLQHKA